MWRLLLAETSCKSTISPPSATSRDIAAFCFYFILRRGGQPLPPASSLKTKGIAMTIEQRSFGIALACIAAMCFPTAAFAQQSQTPIEGICVLMPTEGNHVTGTISLLEEGDALHIAGEVRHLTPGAHGFHIHEFGDLRAPDASTCGGHYNPTHQPHEGLNSATDTWAT